MQEFFSFVLLAVMLIFGTVLCAVVLVQSRRNRDQQNKEPKDDSKSD